MKKTMKTSQAIMIAKALLTAVLCVGCVSIDAGSAGDMMKTDYSISENEPGRLATTPEEPPSITVRSGSTEIDWVVGKNIWNNSIYDRLDNFQWIMRDTVIDELPYIQNGETITIVFDSRIPDSVALTEHLLRGNGDEKYNISGMECEVTLDASDSRASFTIETNWATALSSDSGDYAPGGTIKGYRLVCRWGDNECEYGFIIRGDAAVIMTPIDGTSVTTVSREDWGAFYIQTLHSYMFQDTALSENIDYMAIDLSSLEYASAEDRENVADFFSSAYVPVIDADIERLKEEGLFDESTLSLPNGVLLQVQSVSRSGEEIVIQGMKYRSGLGANGFETKWTANADGSWTMHETVMIWIS